MDTPKDQDTSPVTQEDVDNLLPVAEEETPKPTTKLGSPLAFIRQAIASGTITKAQGRQFRADMGISSGFFTSKQTNPSKVKRIKKMAKQARKINNRARHKGQSNTKGSR